MASIQDLLNQKKNGSRKETVHPGIYPSKVSKVEYDERYADGAYIITYELQGKNKQLNHQELFIDNIRFERTFEFYNYLMENGITCVEDFLGCSEELDLRWKFTNTGKRELTVNTRKFIGFTLPTVEVNSSQANMGE